MRKSPIEGIALVPNYDAVLFSQERLPFIGCEKSAKPGARDNNWFSTHRSSLRPPRIKRLVTQLAGEEYFSGQLSRAGTPPNRPGKTPGLLGEWSESINSPLCLLVQVSGKMGNLFVNFRSKNYRCGVGPIDTIHSFPVSQSYPVASQSL